MELKVIYDNETRVVYDINEKTIVYDVIIALAHSIDQTGSFSLIERLPSGREKIISPQENVSKLVAAKHSQFFLRKNRSEYEQLIDLINMQQTRLTNQSQTLNNLFNEIEQLTIEKHELSSDIKHEESLLELLLNEKLTLQSKLDDLKAILAQKETHLSKTKRKIELLEDNFTCKLKKIQLEQEFLNAKLEFEDAIKINDDNFKKLGELEHLIKQTDAIIKNKQCLLKELEQTDNELSDTESGSDESDLNNYFNSNISSIIDSESLNTPLFISNQTIWA
jgi:chromosome segregation ATPase